MPILVKSDDVRSGRKAKAHNGGYDKGGPCLLISWFAYNFFVKTLKLPAGIAIQTQLNCISIEPNQTQSVGSIEFGNQTHTNSYKNNSEQSNSIRVSLM